MSTRIKLFAAPLLVVLCIGVANAQVEKGDDVLSIAASFNTQASSPTSFSVTGQLAYERYLSQRVALGIGPFINMITSKGSLSGLFGGNLFCNYGFITSDGKFYPYLGAQLSVSQSISSNDTDSGGQTENGTTLPAAGNNTVGFFGAGAKAGAKYFVSQRINIDLNVNYSANFYSTVNGEQQDIGTGGIIQVFFGVGVIVGRRSGGE